MAINVTDDKVAQVPIGDEEKETDYGHVRFASNKELKIATVGNENGVTITPKQALDLNRDANFNRVVDRSQTNFYDQNPLVGDMFFGSSNDLCERKWYIYTPQGYKINGVEINDFQPLTQGPRGKEGLPFFTIDLNSLDGNLYVQYPEGYSISGEPPFFIKNSQLYFKSDPTNNLQIGRVLPEYPTGDGTYNLELIKSGSQATLQWVKKV